MKHDLIKVFTLLIDSLRAVKLDFFLNTVHLNMAISLYVSSEECVC